MATRQPFDSLRQHGFLTVPPDARARSAKRGEITLWLQKVEAADNFAAERIVALVYDELRKLIGARNQLVQLHLWSALTLAEIAAVERSETR